MEDNPREAGKKDRPGTCSGNPSPARSIVNSPVLPESRKPKATIITSKDGIYSVKEVAGILGVSTSTVYNLISKGDLSSFHVGSGRGVHRVKGADILDFIEMRKQAANPKVKMGLKHLSP